MSVIFKIVYDDGAFYIGSSEGSIKLKKIEGKKIKECSIIKTLEEGTTKKERLEEHKRVMSLYEKDEKLIRRKNPMRTEEEREKAIKKNNDERKEIMKKYYKDNKDKMLERAKSRYARIKRTSFMDKAGKCNIVLEMI